MPEVEAMVAEKLYFENIKRAAENFALLANTQVFAHHLALAIFLPRMHVELF